MIQSLPQQKDATKIGRQQCWLPILPVYDKAAHYYEYERILLSRHTNYAAYSISYIIQIL